MADGPISLFSTRAHVFQINPETKASWLPKGESAVPISFVATGPANRRELTIIGTNDHGETVLNCVILPKTVFNKRSQKFGQWHDQNGVIYGLGFNSEIELNEFMDAFRQLQQDLNSSQADQPVGPQAATISQQSHMHQNLMTNQSMERTGSAAAGVWNNKAQQQQHQQQQLASNNSSSEMNGRDQSTPASAKSGGDQGLATTQYPNASTQQQHQVARRAQVAQETMEHDTNNNPNNGLNNGTRYPRSQSMFGMQQQKPSGGIGGRASPDSEISSQNDFESPEQLKYENERLKQVLEESTKNASVWQSELINLRTNNAKLTQALQESKAHVEEWEKELLSLRDENKELKLRVMALESTSDQERSEEHKLNMQEYKNYIDKLQDELREKDDELVQVQRSMGQLKIEANSRGIQNGRSDDPISSEVAISSYQKKNLDSITAKLSAKISELDDIRQEYVQFSDKLYH